VSVSRPRVVSPRVPAAGLPDLGERTAFIARQRVGRARRRQGRSRAARAARVAGLVLLGILTLAGATVGARWLLTAPRFAVARIDVDGASRVSADRVRSAAAIPPGTNLWRLDPAAVAARVSAMPEIRRAEIIRRFPNQIVILVEERRPFTLVHAGRLHWLDEEGRMLDEVPQAVVPSVPVVSGLSDAELGSMRVDPSPRAREAVALIRTLLRSGSALSAEISEIDVSRTDGPVLYTVDGVEVRLGSEEWEERLARLERILRQVGRDGDPVRAIDLRFRDQVVLTKGSPG
jgi:cell division septal protein FtsQ